MGSRASRLQNNHAYADTLPLRRVIGRRTAYPGTLYTGWQVETLECGHEDTALLCDVKRRRCWQCGPKEGDGRR